MLGSTSAIVCVLIVLGTIMGRCQTCSHGELPMNVNSVRGAVCSIGPCLCMDVLSGTEMGERWEEVPGKGL